MYDWPKHAEGSCADASDEFLHILDEVGVEGALIEHYDPVVDIDVSDYPYPMTKWDCTFHWAVRVGEWVIDWTARQFHDDAKFPACWKGETREWRNVKDLESID